MRKKLLILILMSAFTFTLCAQKIQLYPAPDSIKMGKGNLSISKGYVAVGFDKADSAAIQLLNEALKNEIQKKKCTPILIGEGKDKAIKKFSKFIPKKSGAYYLSIENKQIVIAGYDEAGTYYGVQTFTQLLNNHTLPILTIIDAPAIAHRGIVEGFYGTPWSQADRISILRFMGKARLNTYIYGPKDDPYHSSPKWREPYPEKEAAQLKELVTIAQQNKVNFVWAIHPGKDIQWNDSDRNLLLSKFDKMYDLGIRSFAVFFDDISGEGTNPQKQAELLNYIQTQFIQKKKGVAPLVMCPTEYNKKWSNPKEGTYLDILGTTLHPSIQIMWTGNSVISDITEEGLDYIQARIKRPPYIWWNFPVSDYVRDHLLMGPAYGLDTHVASKMSGFVSNPMERAEASKIAIYSVGLYTWNSKAYNPNEAWEKAIKEIMPTDAAALRTFAAHNSDLGKNYHEYRRDESVEIKPTFEKFINEYTSGKYDEKGYTALVTEFKNISDAAGKILRSKDNDKLTEEIRPWLLQFNLLGQKGSKTMELIKIQEKNEDILFWNKNRDIKDIDQEILSIDKTYNQNPYQPGVKTGSLIMSPLTQQLVKLIEKKFYQHLRGAYKEEQQKAPVTETIASIQSDIEQIRKKNIEHTENTLYISPIAETLTLKSKQSICLTLPLISDLSKFEIDLGVPQQEWMNLEISSDDQTWRQIPIIADTTSTLLFCDLNETAAKSIRLTNNSETDQPFFLKQFVLTIKYHLSPEKNIAKVMDGDLDTYYTLDGGESITISNSLLWNYFSYIIQRKDSPYKLGSVLPTMEKAVLLTSPKVNTNITLNVIYSNGKKVKAGTFTSSVSSIALVNYKNIKSIELKNNSGTSAQLFEMIWKEIAR